MCTHVGCSALVRGGSRCSEHAHNRTAKRYGAKEIRPSFRERGYNSQWTELSASYRKRHPLCVMCLLAGRVKPADCVDHIIPMRCCPGLLLREENLQSLCSRCNTLKSKTDPSDPWTPNESRIVACGADEDKKNRWVLATGLPSLSMHGRSFGTAELDRAVDWISEARGEAIVVSDSPAVASRVAAVVGGLVYHVT